MKQCENPHVIRGGAVNHGYNEKKCYKNTHLEVQKVVHDIYFLGIIFQGECLTVSQVQ